MDEVERVKRTATAVVFGGVVSALQARDEDVASQVVRELWPPMIDMSGYEIAAECVLIMVGAFAISDEALDELAIRVMAEAREGAENVPDGYQGDEGAELADLPFAHDSLDDLDAMIESAEESDASLETVEPDDDTPEPEPAPEPEPVASALDMAAIIRQANIDAGVINPQETGE